MSETSRERKDKNNQGRSHKGSEGNVRAKGRDRRQPRERKGRKRSVKRKEKKQKARESQRKFIS